MTFNSNLKAQLIVLFLVMGTALFADAPQNTPLTITSTLITTMDGLEMIKQIRILNIDVPIFILSATFRE